MIARRAVSTVAIVLVLALVGAGCSSDSKTATSTTTAVTTAATTGATTAASTPPAGSSTAGSTAGSTDAGSMCAQVPSVADIESVVTVTLGEGTSQNASGNDCAFADAAGTTSVRFTLLTDPASLTSFAKLGAADGAADLGNEDLPGAKTQLTSVLYALNDALYTVQVTSTSQSNEVSLQQAAALVDLWVSD